MKKYDHALALAFSVITKDETGENITGAEMRAALLERLSDLSDGELIEAVGMPYDTYCFDDEDDRYMQKDWKDQMIQDQGLDD